MTVLRGNDGVLGPITADCATGGGTAVAGIDYQAASGTLAFQENETVKSLNIPILQPRAAGTARAFQVTLSNPTVGATLGRTATTLEIVGAYATPAPPVDLALGSLKNRQRIVSPLRSQPFQRSAFTACGVVVTRLPSVSLSGTNRGLAMPSA